MADSWPVEPARAFWRIWGTLENSDKGRVATWRRARVSLGRVYRAMAVKIVMKEAVTNLNVIFWAWRREGDG